MAFYELVFIIRQEISSSEVDRIIDDFTQIVKDSNGKIIKTEYWGIITLAYKIGNNKKGHYVFLGLEAELTAMKEIERKMKLSENIIRFVTIKVDSINSEPSPILRGKSSKNEEIVDVTIVKE